MRWLSGNFRWCAGCLLFAWSTGLLGVASLDAADGKKAGPKPASTPPPVFKEVAATRPGKTRGEPRPVPEPEPARKAKIKFRQPGSVTAAKKATSAKAAKKPPAAAQQAKKNKPSAPPRKALVPIDPVVARLIGKHRVVDVQNASFQDISPGSTSLSSVKERFGEPKKKAQKGGEKLLTYAIGPFPRVVLRLRNDRVKSIDIHLAEAAEESVVREELQLTKFRAAPVWDDEGKRIGSLYPERGMRLTYAEPSDADKSSGKKSDHQVTTIQLRATRLDDFLKRAERTPGAFQQNLADLVYVEQQNESPRAAFEQARLLFAIDQVDAALRKIEQAIKRDAAEPRYRVLQAELLWRAGQRAAARKALEDKRIKDAPPQVRAWAERVAGDFLAKGSEHNYHLAFKRHMNAIRTGTPLLENKSLAVRREVRRVLIDAHLAVASDLAWGEWKRKEQVVPKWLKVARGLTQEHQQREQGEQSLSLDLVCRSLAAHSALPKMDRVEQLSKEAAEVGKQQIAAAEDPLQKRRLQWKLAECLYYASRIQQKRKALQDALRLAEDALQTLQPAIANRIESPHRRYLLGRLYFQVGSVHSVSLRNHRASIVWFDKARTWLTPKLEPSLKPYAGGIGDRCVSMGVSYWHTGDQRRAIQVTERGVQLLQTAVEVGVRPFHSLVIPFTNLASMHRALGDANKAQRFVAKAEQARTAKRPSPASKVQRR